MIALCGIESSGGHDFGNDLLAQLPLRSSLAGLGELFFLVVCIKNRAAVLIAAVAKLAAGIKGIDIGPENIEQLGIADLVRVVFDLHHLRVPGTTAGHLLISRVLHLAAAVSGSGFQHAIQLVVRGLHAPEATSGEYSGANILGGILSKHGAREKNNNQSS